MGRLAGILVLTLVLLLSSSQETYSQGIFSFLSKKGEYTHGKRRGKGKKMKCGYMDAYNKGRAYRKYKKSRSKGDGNAPTTYVPRQAPSREEILAKKNAERYEALGIDPSTPSEPTSNLSASASNQPPGNSPGQTGSTQPNTPLATNSPTSNQKRLTQEALKNMTEQQRRDTLSRTTPDEVLPPIQFISDQDEFSVVNMDSFMKAMEYAQQGKVVLIEGHTDDLGRAQYNLDLSMKRSEKIREILLSGGVADELISVIGYGESQPKVPNTNDENRAINRRIEFKIFSLDQ
jgi:outer membrane protein OmpA-like peptidoglycan-associated protein